VTVRVVAPGDWRQIELLFGEKGACGGCWCMWWRVERGGKLWDSVKGEPNRAELKRRVEAGEVNAMMAFDGEQPVGWCTFGPRATFPRAETIKALRHAWDADTWAVVCFYIHPKWRRKGVARALLEAATERAFELGARIVEGYPAVPKKPGGIPAVFAWTGVPNMFEAVGYERADERIYVRRRS
jgi:GNAT superfamily N-acetyltransferase